MKAHKGNRSILPFIPKLSTRWRWMVNIMSQPLYPHEKLQCPLNRRLSGVDSFEDDKISCAYQHSKPRLSSPELVTILTTLTWFVWFKYKTIKKETVLLVYGWECFTAQRAWFIYEITQAYLWWIITYCIQTKSYILILYKTKKKTALTNAEF